MWTVISWRKEIRDKMTWNIRGISPWWALVLRRDLFNVFSHSSSWCSTYSGVDEPSSDMAAGRLFLTWCSSVPVLQLTERILSNILTSIQLERDSRHVHLVKIFLVVNSWNWHVYTRLTATCNCQINANNVFTSINVSSSIWYLWFWLVNPVKFTL